MIVFIFPKYHIPLETMSGFKVMALSDYVWNAWGGMLLFVELHIKLLIVLFLYTHKYLHQKQILNGMKLLIRSQTSTATPLKFGNEWVNSPTLYCDCDYLSVLGLQLIHFSNRRPLASTGSEQSDFTFELHVAYFKHVLAGQTKLFWSQKVCFDTNKSLRKYHWHASRTSELLLAISTSLYLFMPLAIPPWSFGMISRDSPLREPMWWRFCRPKFQ